MINLANQSREQQRQSGEQSGDVRNATISCRAGKWYASVQWEAEISAPAMNESAVGIDLGVACFAALSDGSMIDPLNAGKKALRAAREVGTIPVAA